LPDQVPSTATVLVVEDEETLRLSLSKMLRLNGFSVIDTGDGAVAIEYLRAAKASNVEVILLDLTLPGASSLEVIEEARRALAGIKVVLMSAYSLEMAPFLVSAPELSGFIRKPFELVELVQVLREILSKGRAAGA